MNKRIVWAMILGTVILGTDTAMASLGGGSGRIPFTDFFIELYNVTNNIYLPLICVAAVLVACANFLFGLFRMGQALVRAFGVVGLAGLGVTGIGQTVGATAAIGLLLL